MALSGKSAGSKRAQRWRRRKEARPAEIVAAALEVFAERGFAACKLDHVAAKAGISKGTLYLYFRSKEEMFEAVVKSAVLPNIAEAERMVAGFAGPTRDLLQRVLGLIVERMVGTPLSAIPKLVLAEAGNFPALARFYREAAVDRVFALLRLVLARGVARGEFRAFASPEIERCIIGPILMTALWRHSFGRFDPDPMNLASFLPTHLDLLLNGLNAAGIDRVDDAQVDSRAGAGRA